jgi:O-antigen ligase
LRVDLNLWLCLGALVSVGAWLVPDHRWPWPAFYTELLAAVGLLPLAVWTGIRGSRGVPWPRSVQFVALVALVPVVQALLGQIRYGGDAALAAMYLTGFAMAIAIGRQWRREAPASVSMGLPLTALLAAWFTLGLALMQWLGIDTLGLLLASLPLHARPTGNIAQANHMATLLAWGTIAVWLLYESHLLGAVVALAAVVPLLFGLVMSQSRTGWVDVALMLGVALGLRRRFDWRLSQAGAWALGGAFAITVAFWGPLNRALDLAPAMTLAQRVAPGPRLAIWHQFVVAIERAPWFGYGWTQAGLAQQAAVPYTPPLNIVMSDAHNLALDLLVWNGAPLGLVMIGAILVWTTKRVRSIAKPDTILYGLALAALAVHSMFEFPHAYSYFLLPAGLMIGVIEADAPITQAVPLIPRPVWLAAVAVMAGLLVWTTSDYLRVERSLRQYEFDAAHIGTARGSVAPRVHLLTQLGALMRFVRVQPNQGLSNVQLDEMRTVVARFPSAGNQFRLALALARNDRPLEASVALEQLCVMQRAPSCANAMAAWTAVVEQDPVLRAVPISPRTREAMR